MAQQLAVNKDQSGVAQLAANVVEQTEDVGEFNLQETLQSLINAVDPRSVTTEVVELGRELTRITKGTSEIEPSRGDPRFKDVAWQSNPFYKRLGQSYQAFSRALENVINDKADWRNKERAKFAIDVLTSSMAPTNTLLGNPAALKELLDTGGGSMVRGLKNFVHDLRHNKGMPAVVDATPFIKGETIACTPGAVIFRNEVLELIQYTPATAEVHAIPMLLIPPQINRYYFTDLAPGRSLVEYAVSQGIQFFVVSWKNPTVEDGDWNLDTYIGALYEAIDAMLSITRARKFNSIGFCAGGITQSCLAAHMGANNDKRLNSITYAVTLLDWSTPAMVGMLHSERLIATVQKRSQAKGVMSGKDLAQLFAWFRPNELVWNYWVNNYLMGRNPPSFDILAWNADSTNMPGALHAQFLDIFLHNAMTKPGMVKVLGTPIDLGNIKVDAMATGAVTDHLTPWQGCYRTTQLLGSDNIEFVLSSSGHIASLVNPPGNPKSSYYIGPEPGPDPAAWKAQTTQKTGSWWEHWSEWVGQRSGSKKAAPKSLGNKRYPALVAAPGTYIDS